MAQSLDFLYSLESFVELGKFFRAVHERIGEGEIPPGENADRIAKILGLKLPAALEGATIMPTGAHGEPSENDLRITIDFPVEDVTTHKGVERQKSCHTWCQTGPLGIGKVCITVCATCTFKRTGVSCTATATITASI
jgi:hypothetical protein